MTDDRTVRVRLVAEVAKYVRDINHAGSETGKAFRANAAVTQTMNRELAVTNDRMRDIDRSTVVVTGSVAGMNRSFDDGSRSIDRFSGRLGLLVRAGLAVGPAMVPLTTAAVAGLAGIATQAGFAAVGVGVMVTAFQGVGGALDAVRAYQLEPTTENLAKAREALEDLSPAAQAAVLRMRELAPALREIRDAAAEGFFPGFIEGLDDLERLAPTVERIFGTIARASGDLFADGADALAGEEWEEFFAFIEREGAPTLTSLGKTVGNVTLGLAELWMAMDPLSDDMTSGLLEASENFAAWADNLSQTDGYEDFIAYVRETGPQVLDTLGSFGDALLQIGEAAAPLGGPVLQSLELVADAVAAIADSPVGPPLLAAVTAVSAMNLALAAFGGIAKTSFGAFVVGQVKASAGIATLRADLALMRAEYSRVGAAQAVALSGFSNTTAAAHRSRAALGKAALGAGLVVGGLAAMEKGLISTNVAMGASVGMLAGPWGAALGAAAGSLLDFASDNDEVMDSLSRAADIIGSTAAIENQRAALEESRKELAKFREERELTASGAAKGFALGFFSSDFRGDIKNQIEGFFGSSDVEEAALKYAREEGELLHAKVEATHKAIRAEEAHRLAVAKTNPALYATSDALTGAAESAEDFAEGLERIDGLLSRRASLRDYEAALDDFKAGLKDSRDFGVGTESGRANLENLDAIAATAIRRAQELKNAGNDAGAVRILQRAQADLQALAGDLPGAAASLRELKRALAREGGDQEATDFIADAAMDIDSLRDKVSKLPPGVEVMFSMTDLTQSDAEVRAFGESLMLTPREIRTLVLLNKLRAETGIKDINILMAKLDQMQADPKIQVDKGTSLGDIASVRSALARIESKEVFLTVTKRFGDAIGNVFGGSADGGTIPFGPPRHAEWGATVPDDGGPYADRFPYLLAPREEVVSNRFGQADGNRAALKAANRGAKLAVVGRLADGGTAGRIESQLASGHDHRGVRSLGDEAHRSAKAIREERQARLAEAKARLEDLKQLSNEVRSAVVSKFTSDLWAKPDNVWSSEPADWKSRLRTDIRGARQFDVARATLEKRGLDGKAAADLFANADLATVQNFAKTMNRKELAEYERMFNTRERLATKAGKGAGNAALGDEIREVRNEINKLRKDVRDSADASANKITRGVNGAAAAGSRRGH